MSGLFIHEVYMLDDYMSIDWDNTIFSEEDGRITQLVVDENNQILTEYSPDTGERTDFSFKSIRHMEKSDKNNLIFNILFDTT